MEHPAALKATADLSTSLRAAQDDRCLEGIVLSHPSSKKALDGWGTRHPRMFRLRFASLKMTDAWKGLCFPTHRAKSARWMGHLAPGTQDPGFPCLQCESHEGAPGSPKSQRTRRQLMQKALRYARRSKKTECLRKGRLHRSLCFPTPSSKKRRLDGCAARPAIRSWLSTCWMLIRDEPPLASKTCERHDVELRQRMAELNGR